MIFGSPFFAGDKSSRIPGVRSRNVEMLVTVLVVRAYHIGRYVPLRWIS
jgi:hypothetical protein